MSNTPPLRVLSRTSGKFQRPRRAWRSGERSTGLMFFEGKRDRQNWINRVRATAHAQRVNTARLLRLFGGDDHG